MIGRRCLIGALAAGLALPFRRAGAAPPKWGLVAKSAVSYRDHPLGEKSCAGCTHFLPAAAPGGADHCSVVAGVVQPDGYCIVWQNRNPSNTC